MSVYFIKIFLALLQHSVPNKRSGHEQRMIGNKCEVTATGMEHTDFVAVEREQTP